MKSIVFLGLFALLALVPAHTGEAQASEFQVPNLVITDADGRPISQVVLMKSLTVGTVISFAGDEVYFEVDLSTGVFKSNVVWFSGPDCTGDPYLSINISQPFGFEENYGVMGPDREAGTYRVFRATGQPQEVPVSSSWSTFTRNCKGEFGTATVKPAEEVQPNPFEAFRGPTLANPERVLTIEGGTRLP